ncbi:hypothetical protein AB2B38_010170 [Balneola sp. MJW-20]|uniref:hypothetical protein n=1 Tax=Gracilimonas aurantiaca TaxID=3234185 RepID=UPI003464F969
MTSKDRKVQIFLFCFYLLTGLYLGYKSAMMILSGIESQSLFQYGEFGLPILGITISVIAAICSFISSFGLFIRVRWVYGFTLFTSGLMFCYAIENVGESLQRNPYESIPLILMIVIILQSFPFLMKKSFRTL